MNEERINDNRIKEKMTEIINSVKGRNYIGGSPKYALLCYDTKGIFSLFVIISKRPAFMHGFKEEDFRQKDYNKFYRLEDRVETAKGVYVKNTVLETDQLRMAYYVLEEVLNKETNPLG